MTGSKQKCTEHPEPNMEGKILAAAEKMFLQKGYPLTSTTEIAREAGCNQALVHYYFRTKEKLFHTVLQGKVKEVFIEFLSVETGEGSFEEKLARMIETHYDIVRQNSNMVLFLMNELLRDPELFVDLVADIGDMPIQTLSIFQEELDAEIRAGRIRPISVAQLVLNVISLNAFAFAIKPVYARVWQLDEKGMEEMLDQRRKEVVETIIKSLRP